MGAMPTFVMICLFLEIILGHRAAAITEKFYRIKIFRQKKIPIRKKKCFSQQTVTKRHSELNNIIRREAAALRAATCSREF
jgi:hypothetical protein